MIQPDVWVVLVVLVFPLFTAVITVLACEVVRSGFTCRVGFLAGWLLGYGLPVTASIIATRIVPAGLQHLSRHYWMNELDLLLAGFVSMLGCGFFLLGYAGGRACRSRVRRRGAPHGVGEASTWHFLILFVLLSLQVLPIIKLTLSREAIDYGYGLRPWAVLGLVGRLLHFSLPGVMVGASLYA